MNEQLIIELAKLAAENYKEKMTCSSEFKFSACVYFGEAMQMLVDAVDGKEPKPYYLKKVYEEISNGQK